MRYLGIDYGTKRVGLATAEDAGNMAFPLGVIAHTKTLIKDVVLLCEKERIERIVIGESRDNSGKPNPVMEAITEFARQLAPATGLPIDFHPELFTSREAMHLQGDNDQNDASAAAIMLQSYLDRKLDRERNVLP